jgi:hypothetical protein
MSLEDFYSEYKPQINHIVRAKTNSEIKDEDITSWSGCMFETYGEEYDYVLRQIYANRNNHIWTIIENDDDFVIVAGHCVVNRFGYIITEKGWESKFVVVED